MYDESVFERLIASGDVFDLLSEEHQRRCPQGLSEDRATEVIETLLSRLLLGTLEAWATSCSMDTTRDTGTQSFGKVIDTYDFHMKKDIGPVPLEFWVHFSNAYPNNRRFNPVTGDFSYSYTDGHYAYRTGVAHGVSFDNRGLPAITPAMFNTAALGDHASSSGAKRARAGGGRPPAKGWAHFAEELAVFIHSEGLPPGDGAEGESAVYAAIDARLMEMGREGPSRSTVQPVINAVLRRTRGG